MPVFYMGICSIGILWFHRFPRLNYSYTTLLQTLTNCLFKPWLHIYITFNYHRCRLLLPNVLETSFSVGFNPTFLFGLSLHNKNHEKEWRKLKLFPRSWPGYCDMMDFKTSTLLSTALHRCFGGQGACDTVVCRACLELDENLAEYVGVILKLCKHVGQIIATSHDLNPKR